MHRRGFTLIELLVVIAIMRLNQRPHTVPKHYFCPKIPFPESSLYAGGCERAS